MLCSQIKRLRIWILREHVAKRLQERGSFTQYLYYFGSEYRLRLICFDTTADS